jgi:glycosyltransferase involved in cell wall biosynthesis
VHVLILEASLTGHHANYLEHIATSFLAQGHRLTVCVCQEHSDNPLFARVQAQNPGKIAVKVIQPLPRWTHVFGWLGVVGSELGHWLMFKRFYESLNVKDPVDHVFTPYLDYCLHATALLGSPCNQVPWSGICMRPSFHYSGAGVIAPKPKWSLIKERLFYRLLRQASLYKLLTIDEPLEQQTRQVHPLSAQKLVFVPDPAELTNHFDRVSARKQLGIPEQDFVIFVYGAIDGRKGVEHLLAGVHNKQFQKNLKVLVMGRHTPAIRDKFLSEPQVLSIDRYVDTVTEEAGFRAADVVWLGYNAHYAMSGVLVLAAFADKPVIATRNGLIGWMTRQYNLGVAIDCEDPELISQVVHRLMDASQEYPKVGMQTIRELHTWGVFEKALEESLLSQDIDNTTSMQKQNLIIDIAQPSSRPELRR